MVLLPAPGGPVSPTRLARPVRGCSALRISSNPSRWFSTMLTTRASAAGFPASKSARIRSNDAGKYSFLSAPHWRSGALLTFGVVVSQHVQCPMHHQSQQLLSGRDSAALCVLARHLRADVDVAEHCAAFADALEAERDDVGWAFVPEIAPIEPGNGGAPDEGDGEHRVAHVRRSQSHGGRVFDSRSRHRETAYARRDVDGQAARRTLHSVNRARDVRRPSPQRTL